jgi:hypothetical protein
MASALWLTGFVIGIAFSAACLLVLVDVVRSLRAAWGFVAEQHAKARPPQPEPATPLPVRTRAARRPATARRGARRRLAA